MWVKCLSIHCKGGLYEHEISRHFFLRRSISTKSVSYHHPFIRDYTDAICFSIHPICTVNPCIRNGASGKVSFNFASDIIKISKLLFTGNVK